MQSAIILSKNCISAPEWVRATRMSPDGKPLALVDENAVLNIQTNPFSCSSTYHLRKHIPGLGSTEAYIRSVTDGVDDPNDEGT